MGYSDGRKQMRRILSIIERLQKSTKGIRVRDLVDFYDVDITRIYEDLKIIRDFYALKKDKGSYWIESVRPLRWPRITSEETQALELVITASPLAKEPRFEELLKSVLEKLDISLAEHIQAKLEKSVPAQLEHVDNGDVAEERLRLSEDVEDYSGDNDVEKHFRVLEEALYEQKVVRAVYQPGGKTEFVRHILHPYAIFFRKSDWYLEAKSNQSENTSLTFKILRFQNVMLTDETFEIPADFSLSEDLASRWELFSGEPIHVTLKIAAHKAYLVTEKERHRSQEIIERCPDGAVIVRYEVPREEFTFWVLSLGDAVEVLAPPEFRAEFQEIVQRMHEVYSGDFEIS
ncbi:WYL domain-containing protein [Candidatus Poribacteria bacterium]|nr:WYL domain-containing protein [Candidatus Poribacteria bacterium]MYH80346.1 WYL domain-containing protein [Candidatus Poribacteria bacterium]MYK92972.1 WYL domain-containing protein [Candidatus Poribacteria bacterium]